MKKYKKILAIAFACIGIVILATLIQRGVEWYRTAEKIDDKTTARAQNVAQDINNYISNNAYVPYTLAAIYPPVDSAKVNTIPPEISYSKLSYTSYQFCISYKTGIIFTREKPNDNKLIVPAAHGRGQNCQIIHASVDPIQVSGSLRVCDQLVVKNYDISAESAGSINSNIAIASGQRQIVLAPNARGTQGPFIISSNDKVYDASCNHLSAASLKAGQPLYVFKGDNGHLTLVQEKLTWH